MKKKNVRSSSEKQSHDWTISLFCVSAYLLWSKLFEKRLESFKNTEMLSSLKWMNVCSCFHVSNCSKSTHTLCAQKRIIWWNFSKYSFNLFDLLLIEIQQLQCFIFIFCLQAYPECNVFGGLENSGRVSIDSLTEQKNDTMPALNPLKISSFLKVLLNFDRHFLPLFL